MVWTERRAEAGEGEPEMGEHQPLVIPHSSASGDVPPCAEAAAARHFGRDEPAAARRQGAPGHCDPTVNLYDWYVCIRQRRVEQLWPITARGAVY
jgi:hypothetical protein